MMQRKHPANGRAKRALDLALTVPALVLLAPLLLALVTAVACLVGRPVLFRQLRPGRGGRPFELLKFRTMVDLAAADGTPLPDDLRLTRFGRWLRSNSLDELPELFNVLRGDMSLVGPRPLLMDYLPLYTPEQARRHEVPAGITGWAQVNGRNALSWEEKFALDVWYVDHWSLALDVKILLLSVVVVLSGRGVSHAGQATMPRFRGSGVSPEQPVEPATGIGKGHGD